MKRLLKNIPFLSVSTLAIFLTIFLVYKSSENFELYDIPSVDNNITYNSNLLSSIKECDSINVLKNFNYRNYIYQGIPFNLKTLKNDILILDSIYGNEISQNVIYYSLTDSLIELENEKMKNFDAMFLYKKLDWVERFKYYAESDSLNKFLFLGIYDKWMITICNKLIDYLEIDSDLKYQTNFKTITAICKLKGFTIPIGFSSMEKITDYLIEGKYAYIWSRFWYSTPIIFKLLVFVLISYGIFSVYYTTKHIYNQKKSKNEI